MDPNHIPMLDQTEFQQLMQTHNLNQSQQNLNMNSSNGTSSTNSNPSNNSQMNAMMQQQSQGQLQQQSQQQSQQAQALLSGQGGSSVHNMSMAQHGQHPVHHHGMPMLQTQMNPTLNMMAMTMPMMQMHRMQMPGMHGSMTHPHHLPMSQQQQQQHQQQQMMQHSLLAGMPMHAPLPPQQGSSASSSAMQQQQQHQLNMNMAMMQGQPHHGMVIQHGAMHPALVHQNAVHHSHAQNATKPVVKKKKVITPYIRFCTEQRPYLKQKYPDATFIELGKMFGNLWNQLSDQQKAKYNTPTAAELAAAAAQASQVDDDMLMQDGGKKKKLVKRKKVITPYIRFCSEQRPFLKQKYPEATFIELGKMFGRIWNQLNDNQKAKYSIPVAGEGNDSDNEHGDEAREHDPNAPQKPKKQKVITPYIRFCSEQRPYLRQKYPEMTFVDLGKMFGRMWNQLSDDQKAAYAAVKPEAVGGGY